MHAFACWPPNCCCLGGRQSVTKAPLQERSKKRPNRSFHTMLMSGTLHAGVDSRYAWLRLIAALSVGTIGSVGMWSVPVALPAVQAEFAASRADASLAYTLGMLGFAGG